MALYLAKLLGSLTSKVLAHVSPQLDADMTASFDNMRAFQDEDEAGPHPDPLFVAFCDCYLQPLPELQLILLGACSVAVVLVAIAKTYELPAFTVWLVVAPLLAASCLVYRWSTSGMKIGEDKLLPMPSPCSSDVIVSADKKREAKAHYVLKKVLRIKGEAGAAEKLMADAACIGIVDYVVAMLEFLIEYKNATYYFPEEAKSESTKDPKHGKTLAELGVDLYNQIATNIESWCDSLKTVNRSLNSFDGVEALMEIHSCSRDAAEPVEAKKMKGKLRLGDLEGAIQTLSSTKSKELVEGARSFLHEVRSSNPKLTKVQEEMRQIEEEDITIQSLEQQLASCKSDVVQIQGKVKELEARATNIANSKRGGEASMLYYEEELTGAKSSLADARADEKRYTYWMFGPFESVWKNDVELAKKKVSTYTSKVAELEDLISKMKSGDSDVATRLNAEEESNARELEEARGNAKMKQAAEETVQKKQDAAKERRTALFDKIKGTVDKEGYASAKHFLAANKAMNKVADCVSRAAVENRASRAEWVRSLMDVKDLLDYVVRADSLKEQKMLLWKLRKTCASNKVPILQLIRDSRVPATLEVTNYPYTSDPASEIQGDEPERPAIES